MNEKHTVLLVEDSDEDVALVRMAFQRLDLPHRLEVVSNALNALAYLKGDGRYGLRTRYPMPSIVLMDLDMPEMDGFELLGHVRRDSRLRRLPVIVLTNSGYARDMSRAYQLGAN